MAKSRVGEVIGVWKVISRAGSFRYPCNSMPTYNCECIICGTKTVRSSKALQYTPKKVACRCKRHSGNKTNLNDRFANGDETVGLCKCGKLFTKLTKRGREYDKCVTCRDFDYNSY